MGRREANVILPGTVGLLCILVVLDVISILWSMILLYSGVLPRRPMQPLFLSQTDPLIDIFPSTHPSRDTFY